MQGSREEGRMEGGREKGRVGSMKEGGDRGMHERVKWEVGREGKP